MQQLAQNTAPRLMAVDALRGFALLGIMAVNILAFADPYFGTASGPNPAFSAPLDIALRGANALVFELKFYLLFSFLFGYSFTLQMTAAESAGAALKPRIWRRQAGLLVLGLAHGLVLYNGDILVLYSVLGLILFAWRDGAPLRMIRWGVTLTAGCACVWLLLGSLIRALSPGAPSGSSVPAEILVAFSGTAAQTLHYNITHFGEAFTAAALMQGPSALAMFFTGLAAGRMRLLEYPERHATLQRRLLRFGLPVGLAGAVFYTGTTRSSDMGTQLIGVSIMLLTAPMLTAAYVIGLLRLFRTRFGQRLQQALAPMGRMALSNYLGQSLAMSLIFTGYGLGLINRLAPAAVMASVVAIYGLQMLVSHWWMRGHAYGPAEWLLRALTTASLPPWVRPPTRR
jgi:uncharacterized protein